MFDKKKKLTSTTASIHWTIEATVSISLMASMKIKIQEILLQKSRAIGNEPLLS